MPYWVVTIPADTKDQAIYHTILAEMHRMHALLLNLQTLPPDETERALAEHFRREQNLTLGKLVEWKGRRPALYREARADFERQVRPKDG